MRDIAILADTCLLLADQAVAMYPTFLINGIEPGDFWKPIDGSW